MFVLFVVGPHPNDLNGLDVVQDLVNKPVLDVNPSGAGSSQVSNEFLEWGRGLVWVRFEYFNQVLCLGLKTRTCQFLCITLSLIGVDEFPTHQSRSCLHFSMGVLSPLIIDWRIPGMEVR